MILLNILVTSFVCMAFVVCCQCREASVPKKKMHRDGGSEPDEMPPLLPVGDQMDGCWFDFGKKVYVNPKGVVIHLVPSCEHINHGRCRELGMFGLRRLFEKCEEAPQDHRDFYTDCPWSSPYFHEGVKKFVTNRGVEVASDVPVCFWFCLFVS